MAKHKQAWEAESWEELKSLVELDVVKKALSAREKNRLYHKIHNSRNAEILRIAKAQGITAE